MPTAEPYLPHLHFTSSVFGSPMRYMVFNTLVTFGHLAQREVNPLMGIFFDMVAVRPKSAGPKSGLKCRL